MLGSDAGFRCKGSSVLRGILLKACSSFGGKVLSTLPQSGASSSSAILRGLRAA
jgi:hypothetical protein